MKIILNLFIPFLCAGISNLAFSEPNTLETEPIKATKIANSTSEFKNIKIFRTRNGDRKYSIKLSNKWVKGSCDFQGTGEPYALFADLNFDGNFDVWVTGFTDSQGRTRCSDVWLFSPKTKKYEYNTTVSKINNLEVAPKEKILEGGVFNCGCAAQCFSHDIYTWQSGRLLKIARREQTCDGDTIIYKEFAISDGVLKATSQVEGKPNADEYAHRQNGDIHFLKWDSYPVGQR